MRLIIIGCEYTGKTTLAGDIVSWIKANMGAPLLGFHDHFVLPFAEGPEPDVTEEAQQILSLKPKLLEKYSRYMIQYHLNDAFYGDDHHLVINWYYGDAVYAPLCYGYGGHDEYADRQHEARVYDHEVTKRAPDTVLVHLKASPEVVRQRMAANPHPRCILKDQDVEKVLQRFQEEYNRSGIRRRFELDTTTATAKETFRQWLRLMDPHFTPADRARLLTHAMIMKDATS